MSNKIKYEIYIIYTCIGHKMLNLTGPSTGRFNAYFQWTAVVAALRQHWHASGLKVGRCVWLRGRVWLRAPNQWLHSASWLTDESGSHPNMLCPLTSHDFRQMICLLPPHRRRSRCAFSEGGRNKERRREREKKGSRCQEAHWSGQPYARLSLTVNSICTSSDAHPYV